MPLESVSGNRLRIVQAVSRQFLTAIGGIVWRIRFILYPRRQKQ